MGSFPNKDTFWDEEVIICTPMADSDDDIATKLYSNPSGRLSRTERNAGLGDVLNIAWSLQRQEPEGLIQLPLGDIDFSEYQPSVLNDSAAPKERVCIARGDDEVLPYFMKLFGLDPLHPIGATLLKERADHGIGANVRGPGSTQVGIWPHPVAEPESGTLRPEDQPEFFPSFDARGQADKCVDTMGTTHYLSGKSSGKEYDASGMMRFTAELRDGQIDWVPDQSNSNPSYSHTAESQGSNFEWQRETRMETEALAAVAAEATAAAATESLSWLRPAPEALLDTARRQLSTLKDDSLIYVGPARTSHKSLPSDYGCIAKKTF